MEVLCGIDEAGRGCIAGDLVVAGCILLDNVKISELNDSKKISETKRGKLFQEIVSHSHYHIVVIKPNEIDDKGLSVCMKNALLEIQDSLKANRYLFDGNTTFGVKSLETMVKADGKVPAVSAASILAKVTHDTNIISEALQYPEYQFEKHKGYGTAFHIKMIQKYGYTPLHRRSFRLKALEPTLF